MTNAIVDPSAVASVLPPVTTPDAPSAADVARFQKLVDDGALAVGADAYLDGPTAKPAVSPEFDKATSKLASLGAEMREVMSVPTVSPLPDSAPLDLHYMFYSYTQMRHMTVVQTQFAIASKVVEQSSRSMQTLYKLQG